MKKLVLTLAAVGGMFFGTQNVQAQEAGEVAPQETQQQAAQQEEYQKIKPDALPQAVQNAVATHYEGAVTEEAWMQEKDGKKKYKIALSQNSETTEIYSDEKGNWIKDKKEVKQESKK